MFFGEGVDNNMLKPINNHTTKTDLVYNSLLKSIANGELKSGSRLIIKEISELLGVSDSPIREALRKLEAMGFVQIEPCIGAVVAQPSLRWLEEVFIIRAALEGMACRISIPYFEESDLEELNRIYEDMERCKEENNFIEYTRIDKEFHYAIYRKNPYTLLHNLIEEFWLKSEFGLVVFQYVPSSMVISQSEHKELLDALRQKDLDLAERIIKNQKLRVSREVRQHLQKQSKTQIDIS